MINWLRKRLRRRPIDRNGNARGIRGKPNESGPLLVPDEDIDHAMRYGWLVIDGPEVWAAWSWIARGNSLGAGR